MCFLRLPHDPLAFGEVFSLYRSRHLQNAYRRNSLYRNFALPAGGSGFLQKEIQRLYESLIYHRNRDINERCKVI